MAVSLHGFAALASPHCVTARVHMRSNALHDLYVAGVLRLHYAVARGLLVQQAVVLTSSRLAFLVFITIAVLRCEAELDG